MIYSWLIEQSNSFLVDTIRYLFACGGPMGYDPTDIVCFLKRAFSAEIGQSEEEQPFHGR